MCLIARTAQAWDGDTSQFGGSAEGGPIVPSPQTRSQHQQQQNQQQPSSSLLPESPRSNSRSKKLVGCDSANSGSSSSGSGGASRVEAKQEEKEEIIVFTAAPTTDRSRERPLSTIEEMPQLQGGDSDARRKEGHARREHIVPPLSTSSRSTSQPQPAMGDVSLGSTPQGNVSLSSSSVSTSSGYSGIASSRTVPPLRYQSYEDERFFPRLRASLNPADWEAMKAAEKAEREAQIAAATAAAAAEAAAARTSERSLGMLDSAETVGVREEGVEAPKGQLSTE